MRAEQFFDTNILLYGYDLDAPAKRAIARALIEQAWRQPGSAAISVQVLQELQVNLVKKGLPRSEASEILHDYAQWPIVDNTLALLFAALEEQKRWQLSLWDCLILAAARSSGANKLISEDLSHGQDYGGIMVINPFLGITE